MLNFLNMEFSKMETAKNNLIITDSYSYECKICMVICYKYSYL
jgi:hypothetical protein